MKWLVRCAFVLATFVLMPCAHAATTTQGGACPSSANMDGGLYAAPTNCYYVDFVNGSDTNTGTDENHPFKHAVGMMGAGGNVPSGCSSGAGWIFRGGITWNYTIAPWYIGTNANCTGDSAGNDSYGGCTGSHCVYFGVDKTWYVGTAWTRPIFSWGDWSSTSPYTCYYDVAQAYLQPYPGFQPTNFFNLSYQTNIIVDNFEFTGMCSADQNSGPDGIPFANYISGSASSGYYTIENCYFHRAAWYLVQDLVNGNVGGDFAYAVSFGNSLSQPTYAHYTYNVVDWSDSGPTTTYTNGYGPNQPVWVGQATFGGVVYYDHSVAAYLGDATADQWGTVRDSLFFWASNAVNQNSPSVSCGGSSCAQHPHIANDSGCGSVGGSANAYWYNNVIDTAVYGQMWQPLINGGSCTFYIFNNVITNVTNVRNLNFGSTSNGITFQMFNNTLECGNDTNLALSGPTYPTGNGGTNVGAPPSETCGIWGGFTAAYLYNTHFITTGKPITCGQGSSAGSCTSFTTSAGTTVNANFTSIPGNPSDIVTQSQATANGQGYSYTQTYEFSPTSSSSATVGVGVNETALCNSMPDSGAAAACKLDTTYAVTYNKANHTAVCCARIPNARPATGPWDVGAYEYSAASTGAPQPPTGLIATVQ